MQVAFSTYPKDDFVKPDHKIQDKTAQPVHDTKVKTGDKTVETEKTPQLEEIPTQGNVSLKFKQDQDTGKLVVEMIDDKTGDAIRQMPTEASLRFSKIIGKIEAKFVNKKV